MTTALIFDLDGTLVDTAPDLLGALNRTLAGIGRRPVDRDALRHMVGHGSRVLIDQALRLTGEPVEKERLAELVALYIADYRNHIVDASLPFPGVVETLETWKADGVPMGVLTNKPLELSQMLLSKLGLDKYFLSLFGQGRAPYTKPDPRTFQDVLGDLGGGAAIMIGDSITDLSTARAAGAPVILVSYGYTPEPASTLGADAVVDRFADIPAAVRKLSV